MFDDQVQSTGGTVPPNLPIGEPEDIFATVEPNAPAIPALPADDVDVPPARTALSAGVLRPKADTMGIAPDMAVPSAVPPTPAVPAENLYAPPVPPPSAMVPPAVPPAVAPLGEQQSRTMPTDVPEMYAVREPKTSRGIVTVLVILLVLVILGIGGFFLYTTFISKPSTTPTVQDTTENIVIPTIDTIDTTVPDTETNVDTGTEESGDRQSDILFGVPVDTDADGLEDQREVGLGTDPAHWDTDGDELSDGDEVIIWKTDPLNPDTDGDGFKDGAEIKNGYNPTGPGKIFEPPAPGTTTSTP